VCVCRRGRKGGREGGRGRRRVGREGGRERGGGGVSVCASFFSVFTFLFGGGWGREGGREGGGDDPSLVFHFSLFSCLPSSSSSFLPSHFPSSSLFLRGVCLQAHARTQAHTCIYIHSFSFIDFSLRKRVSLGRMGRGGMEGGRGGDLSKGEKE